MDGTFGDVRLVVFYALPSHPDTARVQLPGMIGLRPDALYLAIFRDTFQVTTIYESQST